MNFQDPEISSLQIFQGGDGQLAYGVDYYLFEKRVRLTIGRYEHTDVRGARRLARKALLLASKGIDPAQHLNAPEWQETATSETLGQVVSRMIAWRELDNSVFCEFIATHLLAAWGHRSLDTITPTECKEMCSLVERRKAGSRKLVIEFLRNVFYKAYTCGLLAEEHPNPLSGIKLR